MVLVVAEDNRAHLCSFPERMGDVTLTTFQSGTFKKNMYIIKGKITLLINLKNKKNQLFVALSDFSFLYFLNFSKFPYVCMVDQQFICQALCIVFTKYLLMFGSIIGDCGV